MKITVETTINAPIEKVWNCWTSPEHIVNWNFASEEWCCPEATNDLKEDGNFSYRMEARDGSMGFDFSGRYLKVDNESFISYIMADGRIAEISFSRKENNEVALVETFDAENTNSEEMQRAGWQAILNNFKSYVESLNAD